MLKRMAITCALVLLLGGPVLAEDTGQLAVKITDPEGKPLAGVQVMAWTREHVLSGTTGADGMWRSTASPGEYAVGVRAHSRVGTERYEITVAAGETTEIEFELEPGVTFIGRVVDAAGEPVVGADVVVEAGGTYDGYMEHTFGVPPWARDRTNAKGEFFVGGIPDTKVATVVVSAEGYQTTRMGIRAMDGAIHPDPVVVRLRAGASVSGRVTTPDGKPAAGATVYVIPTDVPQLLKSPTSWVSGDNGSQERALQATTEDDGSYRVEGAQIDREYLVKAQLVGYALSTAEAPVTPTAAEPAVRSDVTLAAGAGLSLRLRSPEGEAITVAAVKVGSAMTSPELEAANDGERFAFSGLVAGRTSITIEAPGYLKQFAAADLKSGETTELEVELDPGVRIRGTLRTPAGEPVAGVRVATPLNVENPVTGWTSYDHVEAKTDAEGRFDLGPLTKGSYELELFSQAWRIEGKPVVEAPAKGVAVVAHRLAKATLRFVRPDGSPYTGSVFVWRALAGVPGTSSGSSEDTEEGRVTLKAIGHQATRFTFEFDEYATVVRDVASKDGTDLDLGDIRLDPGVTLRGRALLPSGEPAAEASIRMMPNRARADADGRFALERVPAGTTVISIKAEGLPRAFFVVEVSEGTKEQIFRLIEGIQVKTLLLDADGKPAPHTRVGIDVMVAGAWRSWGSGRSDESGRFEGRLLPGRLRFTWSRKYDEPFVTLLETEITEGEPREITLRLPKRGG